MKTNTVGLAVVSGNDYIVNEIGQRTDVAHSGTAFSQIQSIQWGYDFFGQLATANHSVNAQDRAFEYDAIGNRKKAADSLTLPGADNYTANSLNQYTEVPTVGLPAVPSYGEDGNMTADGKGNTLVWDGDSRREGSAARDCEATRRVPMAAGSRRHQNRLIEWLPTNPAAGDKRVVNTYDGQSRRVRKQVYEYASDVWILTSDLCFLYGGWNPVAIYTLLPSSFTLLSLGAST